MDRFLGFLFGAARGVVLIGVFVILGQLLKLDGEAWWRALHADSLWRDSVRQRPARCWSARAPLR